MSIVNKKKTIVDLLSFLDNSIDVDKKYCGFSKCNLLKLNKKEIKGIPYLCNLNKKYNVLMKIFPCEVDKERDNSLAEITYLCLFNDEILYKNILPNIPYVYNYYIHLPNDKKCLTHVPYKKIEKIDKIEKYSNILLCEYFPEKDIDVWVDNNEKNLTEAHWKSIIFQVIYTLSVLQDKYHFMHNDLHPGNILIETVEPDIDIEYNFYNKNYKVRNLGFIAKLWDFEFSNLFKPEYSKYKNSIEFEINYNQSYDLHNFLKGLLQIDILPLNTKNFINKLYPSELIYNKNGEINTSNNTIFLNDGLLSILALEKYKLPIPQDLLDHPYFLEYNSENPTISNKFIYP